MDEELGGQFGKFYPHCCGQWLTVLMHVGDKRFPSGVHDGITAVQYFHQ